MPAGDEGVGEAGETPHLRLPCLLFLLQSGEGGADVGVGCRGHLEHTWEQVLGVVGQGGRRTTAFGSGILGVFDLP